MTATIYTLESVNMICGDTGQGSAPGVSTHLVLQELKLPGLEENYVDHAPGGAGIDTPARALLPDNIAGPRLQPIAPLGDRRKGPPALGGDSRAAV